MSQRDENHAPPKKAENSEKPACTVYSLSDWRARRGTAGRGPGRSGRARPGGRRSARSGAGRGKTSPPGYRGVFGYGYGPPGSARSGYGGYGGFGGWGGLAGGAYGAYARSGSGGKGGLGAGPAGQGGSQAADRRGGSARGSRDGGPGGAGGRRGGRRRGDAKDFDDGHGRRAGHAFRPARRLRRTVLWLAALAFMLWFFMWLQSLSAPAVEPGVDPPAALRFGMGPGRGAAPAGPAAPSSSTLFHVLPPPLRPQ